MIYDSEHCRVNLMLGGDVMLGRRLSVYDEPAYLELVELFRRADLGFANLETTLRRSDEGTPNISPGTYMTTDPALLDDLKWFGINMVACANNHAFDYGEGGVMATCRHLHAAGIAHAGSGANLTLSRKPAYVDTAAGRIALVAATATFPAWSRAGEARADMPGRPGVNPLRSTLTYAIRPEQLAVLDRVADDLGFRREAARNRQHFFSEREVPQETAQQIQFLGQRFVAADQPGISSVADPSDLAENLRWIGEARRQSDWVIASIHSHEFGFAGSLGSVRRSDLSEPADFVVAFARAAIDAGADLVAGHGSHTPLAVEMYRGKPIFYGLGNLIFHNDTVAVLPAEAYERFDLDLQATPADFQDARTARDTKGHPGDRCFWENIVAECRFEQGQPARIILHPIEQGHGLPRAQRGRPVLAGGAVAERVIERVIRLSAHRGTRLIADAGKAVLIPADQA